MCMLEPSPRYGTPFAFESTWEIARKSKGSTSTFALARDRPLHSNNQEDPLKKQPAMEDDLLYHLAWHAEDYKICYSENYNKNWGCSSIDRALW